MMKFYYNLRLMILVIFLSLCFISCREDDKTSDTKIPQITLTIISINPIAGSSVTSTATLTAELQYLISNFDSTQSYAVFIRFKRTDNSMEFIDLINDIEPVTSASGNVTYEYPVSAEVADSEILKPLKILYTLHSYSPGGVQPGEPDFDYKGSHLVSTTTVTCPAE